jgi:xanthosine utilization system XapX-like protein
VALLAYCLYALVNVEVPTPNKDPLLVVIGILSGAVGTVTQFYFGSSVGHKKQAETIDTLAQTANTVAQTANPTPSIPVSPGESITVEGKE